MVNEMLTGGRLPLLRMRETLWAVGFKGLETGSGPWLQYAGPFGVLVVADTSSSRGNPVSIADFQRADRRIVAFLADDAPGAGSPWPQTAERYAAEKGIAMTDARWYEVRPRRFTNGRPHVSRYLPEGQGGWAFETDLDLAREIIVRLGYDPDALPLDL